ncbi:MAG: hypothetical protein RL136_1869 [Planctomycetota bacterium]|jgi:hypothetical protein
MDSLRPIPFRTAAAASAAAAAYGIKPKPAAPRPPVDARSGADRLVAARVDAPIDGRRGFDTPAPARTTPVGNLQMYTRAADRMEVATAVQVGRILDTKA